MVQKKIRIAAGKYHLMGLIAVVAVMSAIWHQSFISYAESPGTVTADSAKIRENADTSSEVIGSAARGTTVSIRDEVQDASGTLWYQVYVNANTTGYIRSDLVSKKEDDGSQNGETQNAGAGNAQPAPGASVQPDSVMDAQYAVVSAEAIKVRTAPSTSDSVVDRLEKDVQVIVSGQSEGSDGRTWYYVTFTGTNGAERSGFIRSDLLTLGDMVPVPEEEEPESQAAEPVPEKPVNNDYELTYEREEDGSYTWYLYDYTEGQNGYRQRLQELLDTAQTREDESSADTKTLVKQRIIIVILIFLAALLIAVIVIMALKLRDVYYEEYEDEEEDEEEQGDASAQRDRRDRESSAAPAQRRRRREEPEETSGRRRRRTEEDEEESEAERPVRGKPMRDERKSGMREVEYHDDESGRIPLNSAPKRKTKNFLLDDDEFEFEFLSMDDKDLS